jgi:hypothetical protein
MSTITWLQIAAVGIVFGAAGQLARTIVGFKKLYDYTDGVTPAFSLVDGMRLFVSIAIGGRGRFICRGERHHERG